MPEVIINRNPTAIIGSLNIIKSEVAKLMKGKNTMTATAA